MAGELQKPLLGPENFNRDGIDLEHLPLEEVFQQLKTSQRGLSSEDAEARIHIFGPNKLEENPVSTNLSRTFDFTGAWKKYKNAARKEKDFNLLDGLGSY